MKFSNKKLCLFVRVIDDLAIAVHQNAVDKGFYDDFGNIHDILKAQWENDENIEEVTTALASAYQWLKSTAEQAAIARMHSELSEWLETVRKKPGLIDDHCPEFLSAEIEAADVIIRVLETCAEKQYRIGEAIIAKMEFNRSRPYKHSKNS